MELPGDNNFSWQKTLVPTLICILLYFLYRLYKTVRERFFNDNVAITTSWSEKKTNEACERLRRDCKQYRVLGFDTEYDSGYRGREPVALVQLCTHKGTIELFRICHMNCTIPDSLISILEDSTILKVGVGTYEDAMNLEDDYGIRVRNTLDLRYIHKGIPGGLKGMAKELLNLDMSDSLACSRWGRANLTDEQIIYAGRDAYAGLEIFKQAFPKQEVIDSAEMNIRPFYNI